MQNIQEIIKEKLLYLKDKGVESSNFELRLMLANLLNIEVGNLHFFHNDISQDTLTKFNEMVEQRALFCPVDKILGCKGFYKHDFIVNQDVLSPRADTEILVEQALKNMDKTTSTNILEFGVGSGCIIISLLFDLPLAQGLGVDISSKALNICQQNAKKIGVGDRLKLKNISWFDDLWQTQDKLFDLIISNPPYIPTQDIDLLDKEVKNFDPITALDGGSDGLRDYRRIIKIAPTLLKNNGLLILEAGINQANDIVKIGKDDGLEVINIVKDLNNIERCIILKK